MDRLTEMEAFTAVVEQGGFTGAAKRLGISKSAVSKHVSSLETRLGVRLLERTTRRVMPTDIGLVYYDRARLVLGAAIDADQMVAAKTQAPEGPLIVAVGDGTALRYVGAGLNDFLKAYPRILLRLLTVQPHGTASGETYDLAVATGQADAAQQSEKLADIACRLVAAPDYIKREGAVQRIEDLSSHPLLHDGEGQAAMALVSRTGERRTVHGSARLVVRNTAMVLSAAEAGLGVAFLPEFVAAEALASRRLVDAMPDLPEQSVPLLASYAAGDRVNPKIRAFLEHFQSDVGRAGGTRKSASLS